MKNLDQETASSVNNRVEMDSCSGRDVLVEIPCAVNSTTLQIDNNTDQQNTVEGIGRDLNGKDASTTITEHTDERLKKESSGDPPILPVFHIVDIEDIEDVEANGAAQTENSDLESSDGSDTENTKLNKTADSRFSGKDLAGLISQQKYDEFISNMEKGINDEGATLDYPKKFSTVARRSMSVRERSKPKPVSKNPYLSVSAPHIAVEETVASTINAKLRSWLKPMDNKMNMKVFGSRRAMRDEQMRYSRAGWVIHPTSIFRLYWDMWILLLLMINMFVLPVAISFFANNISTTWTVFNIVSDTAFIIDIVLNFRTGVLVHGSPNKFILDPQGIAVRYLRTWFFVDFLSSLPIDYIVEAATHSSTRGLLGATRTLRILRLAKLFSLLKLLRLSRLVRYVQQYEEILNITRSVIRFTNLISLILLVAHWNGCMQFLVPFMYDFPDTSWVSINNLIGAHWTEQYLWALFKALSHMLCIGYGRYPPQNLAEVYVTTFSMMTGATFYAMFIAYCINFIQQLDSPRRHYREKIQQIEEYMSYRRLPVALRDKMTKYYEHRYQERMFDEEKILNEISRPLREKVINYNCRDLVQSVPFFVDADPDFVSAIILNLKFEVYLEGDDIIREGELGTEMYFLKEGVVQVTVGGVNANELFDGAYFGEICLLTNTRRTASVKAKSVCDVFILHAEDFRDAVDEFPTMRLLMEKVAEERLNKMGKPVDLSALNVLSAETHVRFKSSSTCNCDMLSHNEGVTVDQDKISRSFDSAVSQNIKSSTSDGFLS